MKMNAREVNVLKANIEGCADTESLYKRLKWNQPKTVRLNMVEKDIIQDMMTNCYSDKEEQELAKKLTGRKIQIGGEN
jgi:predicted flavoprotein YhiN